jgi:hypothetical protein
LVQCASRITLKVNKEKGTVTDCELPRLHLSEIGGFDSLFALRQFNAKTKFVGVEGGGGVSLTKILFWLTRLTQQSRQKKA